MSGSIINAQIPMHGGYGPDIGAAISQGLSNANDLIKLQQVQQQIRRQNQLRGILGAPDAIDVTTGMPKPDTFAKVMSVDPEAGLKLQQNALMSQDRKLRTDVLRSKASAEQAQMLNDAYTPIHIQYKEAIEKGVPREQALAEAQKATTEATQRLSTSGGLPPEIAQNLPTKYDPADFERRALQTSTYLDWAKQQNAERRADARLKEQYKHDESQATATGVDIDGRPIVLHPNASDPKRQATYLGTNDPVPPEKLTGAHKMGTGGTGAKDADNAAIEADILKDHPEWTPGQAKLERIRQTKQAGFKPEDPSKGWETLIDPTDETPYQHHKGTGENKTMMGEPYQPKGARRVGTGGGSVASMDEKRLVRATTFAYEQKIGHPVSTPEEQANLDKLILDAKAKQKEANRGTTSTRADQKRIEDTTRFNLEKKWGHPLDPENEEEMNEYKTAVLAAEQHAKEQTAAGVTTARKTAEAPFASPAAQEREAQKRITEDDFVKRFGHPPETAADKIEFDRMLLGAEDERKRKLRAETPAQAAERDAMAIADGEIAKAEQNGPLDDAQKAAIRQKARSDPKVAEAARKKAESFGVPETPEERESIGAQAATGMPLTQIVPGYGTAAVGARKQARQDAIQRIMDETGMSAPEAGVELANRGIEYLSGRKSSGQLTTMLGATRQAVKQLDFNVDKTKAELKKLPSTNLSPIINAIMRGEEKWTGEPAYSSLFYYMNAVAMESARILSGGQASIQQLHEGARKEAERWANINMTPASFEAVAKAIQDEGHERLITFDQALKEGRVGPKATQWPTPNDKAKEDIRKNPDNAPMFDQAFGPGAAKRVLGEDKSAPAAKSSPAAAAPNLDTMQSATGPGGKKIYWDGKTWINPDGTPYKP